MTLFDDLKQILIKIYGDVPGVSAFNKILPLIQSFEKKKIDSESLFSEEQVVLITYGDSLSKKKNGKPPLKTLHGFACQQFQDVFSIIHILPFFPYSSDDGFSVMDFLAVDPDLGSWKDIQDMNKDFQLMFDYVLNHVSAQSQWFKDYLAGEKEALDLAIEVEKNADISMVTRPRALPLLTEFIKKNGQSVKVWTTFSEDQIDLNYKSSDVLYKMISVFLHYVQNGAILLRLDAIAYLWKEIGTSCIHLPQTHAFVKLLRKILDIVAPHVLILTETNVPHSENISYFGNGKDEAQVVYNFTLPPLLLYSFLKQDARLLTDWAKTLKLNGENNTFLNFTASHDGIGVRPLEGILPKTEIEWLAHRVLDNGGHISYKQNAEGSQSPYELNITYVSAMADQNDLDQKNQIKRFLASQAIQYALPGIPATYIHSILGSQNWSEGVNRTNRFRTINREKLDADTVARALDAPDGFRSKIFFPYLNFINTRKRQPAFHPKAGFEIMDLGPAFFGIKRFTDGQEIYCLTNMTSNAKRVSLPGGTGGAVMADLISGGVCDPRNLVLSPYEFVWLSKKED